jgi:hypothetical protein
MGHRSLRFRFLAVLLCAPLGATVTLGADTLPRATATEGVDLDGDGWSVADGDCCDSPADGCGPEAPWINPGAFEIPATGLDEDCDGTVDNVLPSDCSTAPKLTGLTGSDLARALDLCPTTVSDPPPAERRWGVLQADLLRATGNDSDTNLVNFQAAVFTGFGTNNTPVANATMAALATKTARDAGDPGFQEVEAEPAWVDFRVAPLHYEVPGCPAGPFDAVNSARLRLLVRVPTNAVGFTFQSSFFSAEFPEQCQQYDDHALALLTGLAPGIPADHNILLDSTGNYVTSNHVFYQVCTPVAGQTCPLGSAGLAGTGFDVNQTGGGTSWVTTSGPLVGGEDILLEIHLFNLVDGVNNDLLLLDGFEWTLRPTLVLLVDGFESADTSRWSATVP